MLISMLEVFSNRNIVLSRELTKRHEEFIYGTIEEIIEIADELKGEMVIVVEGKKEQVVIDDNILIDEVNELIQQGVRLKDATKQIALKYNVSKNELYRKCMKN